MEHDYLKDMQVRLKRFAQERDWEQFHTPKNLVMALSVEVAELLEHFQWLDGAQSANLPHDKHAEVALEMADVFIYLMRLCEVLNVDLAETVEKKIKMNAKKYPVKKVRGSAKKYTEY